MRRTSRVVSLAAVLGSLVLVNVASADTVKCQRAILRNSAKFLQAVTKAKQKCSDAVAAGSSADPCPDVKTELALAKATSRLALAIGKSCGGNDRTCGLDLANEETRVTLGWPAKCPNLGRSSACDIDIHDCADIAACLSCTAGIGSDHALDLYYGSLNAPGPDQALRACQRTIGKSMATFLAAKSKALQKCWDGRLQNKHASTCTSPATGDGKYLAAIAKARIKSTSAICRTCGGADQACSGGDDLTPIEIGFPAACPAVTIPGGGSCGGPISDLQSLVDCVACVTEHKVDCVDHAQVPELTAYPSECATCAIPAGPCPTELELTANGAEADLDTGWTGLGHDQTLPNDARITLALSGCAGASSPGCGICSVAATDNRPDPGHGCCAFGSGGICYSPANKWICESHGGSFAFGAVCRAGRGGCGDTFRITLANRRCTNALGTPCTDDVPCGGGTCEYFFGAPLGRSLGGIPVCITNQVVGPVSGTVDVDGGASDIDLTIRSIVHATGTVENPCPRCVDGMCDDGPRTGMACSTDNPNPAAHASLDCPPNPGDAAATLDSSLQTSTGTQLRTLSASNPSCAAPGYAGNKCFCDTCNDANAEPCSVDADCPLSCGNAGVCGGKRCLGGGNNGCPCTVTSECPGGGACGTAGVPTAPNACAPADGAPDGCQPTGNNEGVCVDGPSDSVCSIESSRTCATDADCQSPTCPTCLPGQTCTIKLRECFTDNGVVGGSVAVTGTPDSLCVDGYSQPALGATFCVGSVGSTAPNTAAGLPGLGRVRLPLKATLFP